MTSDPDSSPRLARTLDSLALAASLDTAVRVGRSCRDRRAGVDPSAQEREPVASARLDHVTKALRETSLRVRLHLLFDASGSLSSPEEDVIRRFEELMIMRKGAEMLRTAHQCLLSLYPMVGEAIVEDARRLQRRWEQALDAGSIDSSGLDALDAFIDQLPPHFDSPDGH